VANVAAEAVLAGQIFHAWTAFLRGEKPAAEGLPQWPEYTSGNRPTMILDHVSRVEQAPREQELRLWDWVLQERFLNLPEIFAEALDGFTASISSAISGLFNSHLP